MHGTRLNNIKLPARERHQLKSGDMLRFGILVTKDSCEHDWYPFIKRFDAKSSTSVDYFSKSFTFESKPSSNSSSTAALAKGYSVPDDMSSYDEYSDDESSNMEREGVSSDAKSSLFDEQNEGSTNENANVDHSQDSSTSEKRKTQSSGAEASHQHAQIQSKDISVSNPNSGDSLEETPGIGGVDVSIGPKSSLQCQHNHSQPRQENIASTSNGDFDPRITDDGWQCSCHPRTPPQLGFESSDPTPAILPQTQFLSNNFSSPPALDVSSMFDIPSNTFDSDAILDDADIANFDAQDMGFNRQIPSISSPSSQNNLGQVHQYQHLRPITTTTAAEPMDVVTKKREAPKTKSKNRMSIEDILDSTASDSAKNKRTLGNMKRKADEMSSGAVEAISEARKREHVLNTETPRPSTNLRVSKLIQQQSVVPDALEGTSSNQSANRQAVVENERARKRAKRRHGASAGQIVTSALVGAVAGGIGMFAALAFLPESYFL